MDDDIYHGRCRDCFDKFPNLALVTNTKLADPFIPSMFLCPTCLQERQKDLRQLKHLRPFGIPPDIATASWVDLEPVVVEFDGGKRRLQVQVRFRMPTILRPTLYDGGEVRMKLGDNLYWDAGEHLGGRGGTLTSLQPLILSGVRLMLHYRFGPRGKVLGLAGNR